ncbi:MAG: sulfurtransferase TusA family protein [Magnetovibrio sp.]|nr:sulfurtransferase TusA family protein [Magnetovibrio sp.]
MSNWQPDQTLDTSGKCCPMPMVEMNQAIRKMDPGSILEVIATDPGTRDDISSWCQRKGHELLELSEEGKTLRFTVRKAS